MTGTVASVKRSDSRFWREVEVEWETDESTADLPYLVDLAEWLDEVGRGPRVGDRVRAEPPSQFVFYGGRR